MKKNKRVDQQPSSGNQGDVKTFFEFRKERQQLLLAGGKESTRLRNGGDNRFAVSEECEKDDLSGKNKSDGQRGKNPAVLDQRLSNGILWENVYGRKRPMVARDPMNIAARQHPCGSQKHH